MQVFGVDHNVVLPGWVVRVEPKRVAFADEPYIGGAKAAILAGKPVAPAPLLADDLDFRRVAWDGHELVPDKQARRQHRGNAERGRDREPELKLLVFRLVMGGLARSVSIAEDAPRHEADHHNEDNAGNPESDDQRLVDVVPV